MARKTDENGQRLPVHDCPVHGEYIADASDSPCPACEEAGTEYIKCEHCAQVFDHDTTEPWRIFCPYCGKEITEASETVV